MQQAQMILDAEKLKCPDFKDTLPSIHLKLCDNVAFAKSSDFVMSLGGGVL